MSAYISVIEGFKADCAKLLKLFVETKQYDFDSFIQIWQNMKFSLVFCNCSLPELKLYTAHVFLVVKSYMTVDNFSTLGPFYLMYALYYKQPARLALIRMTKEEMESLMRLTDEYVKKNYYVPAFMLAKLQSEKAFYFTAESQVFAMDHHFERNFSSNCDFKSGIQMETDFVKSLVIDSGWYTKWKALEDEYNKLKSDVHKGEENETKKRKIDPEVSENLSLPPTNLLSEFNIKITDIKDAEEQSCKTGSASGSVGQSRQRLKKKIFAAPVIFDKYVKKDDGNDTVVTEASSEPGGSESPKIKRFNGGKWKHYLKDAINHGK